jgi:hypothetical protein
MYQPENIHTEARKAWQDSYVFRTINISKLLGAAMGDFDNMLNEDDGAKRKAD